ncbi:hypothetical protein XF24_00205 [candidate division SR1 bacterium Aalborg_AAW-1]|nr:hypothetical protein XF24_00205 [candidate division SR1 bacterium Aalborg_AAW-1]
MNTDIEKNILPDSHESFDQKKQIDDKLHDLDYSVDKIIIQADNNLLSDEVIIDTGLTIQDLKTEIKKNQSTLDTLHHPHDRIQDEKRVVKDDDNHLPHHTISLSAQQAIEQQSEDPMSIVGRTESFMNVELFAQKVAQESGILAKIARYLS